MYKLLLAQGYLVHKKTPPPLRPARVLRVDLESLSLALSLCSSSSLSLALSSRSLLMSRYATRGERVWYDPQSVVQEYLAH